MVERSEQTTPEPSPAGQAPDDCRVVLLNDDHTPMEFVVYVLERFFAMERDPATQLMLQIHLHGSASCGVFSRAQAESFAAQVRELARAHKHPLQCEVQPV